MRILIWLICIVFISCSSACPCTKEKQSRNEAILPSQTLQSQQPIDFSKITRIQYVEWDVSNVQYFARVKDLAFSDVPRKAFLQKNFDIELLFDKSKDSELAKIKPSWSWELVKAGENNEKSECADFRNKNQLRTYPSRDLEDHSLVMWFVYESPKNIAERELPITMNVYHLDGCVQISTYEKTRRKKPDGNYEIVRYAIFPPK